MDPKQSESFNNLPDNVKDFVTEMTQYNSLSEGNEDQLMEMAEKLAKWDKGPEDDELTTTASDDVQEYFNSHPDDQLYLMQCVETFQYHKTDYNEIEGGLDMEDLRDCADGITKYGIAYYQLSYSDQMPR